MQEFLKQLMPILNNGDLKQFQYEIAHEWPN
jgi:hypothetical protein